jgi:hypothetical protein
MRRRPRPEVTRPYSEPGGRVPLRMVNRRHRRVTATQPRCQPTTMPGPSTRKQTSSRRCRSPKENGQDIMLQVGKYAPCGDVEAGGHGGIEKQIRFADTSRILKADKTTRRCLHGRRTITNTSFKPTKCTRRRRSQTSSYGWPQATKWATKPCRRGSG